MNHTRVRSAASWTVSLHCPHETALEFLEGLLELPEHLDVVQTFLNGPGT